MARKQTTPTPKQGEIPPGFKLRHTLRGHFNAICRIAWSPDGRKLASPSNDGTVRIWDVESGNLLAVLWRHEGNVYSVAWSPDGRTLVSADQGYRMRLWDTNTWAGITATETLVAAYSVAWSPDERIASGGEVVKIWDVRTQRVLQRLNVQQGDVYDLAWSPGGVLAIGAVNANRKVRLWDTTSEGSFEIHSPHTDNVASVAWSPDGRLLASGGGEGSIQVWDVVGQRQVIVLEGHTDAVLSLSFSADGRLLASKSADDTVRLWRTDSWLVVAKLSEASIRRIFAGLAFHPTMPSVLATLGERDTVIRIWHLDLAELLGGELVTESIKYTTAKIVLVGDSGVGKTGLGWRLAHDAYKEHDSTHGQQFWVVGDLGQRRADGTECEAVLWDLAGQPDYRLVHSLFLDDVDLALVLFDPTNRQEPLGGTNFWLKQLKQRRDRLCRTILIGARADRGSATLTDAELAAYCRQQGISGDFMMMSAKTGAGLPELIEQIKAQIPWDELTATVTTATFKRIKEYVLKLKEDVERKGVLVEPAELRRRLEVSDPAWEFSDDEMLTAVRHLATHGYVTLLRGSRGDISILLAPDLLANLAASFVLEARRNPRGLGVLEEDRLLRGDYSLPELAGLADEERDILLDATAVLFLEHNICFRETFNEQIFLVFPSLINEKRPLVEEIATFEDVSYRVVGAVENVYASLVVLLGYTNTFTRTNQWQNQAQYQLSVGEVCGFRQIAPREGEVELVLYYALDTPKHVQLLFQGLFERFLSRRELAIARYQLVVCPTCRDRLARNVVIQQLDRGRDFSFCNGCGERLALPPTEDLTGLPRHEEQKLAAQQAVATQRTAFEAAIVRIKRLLRDRADEGKRPTCFISYAWGVPEHERWVVRLAKDMQNAGVDMLLDRWHNPPGSSLTRFTDQIDASEFVVVVGTPELRVKYETQDADPVVASELLLINTRLRQPSLYGDRVIPLLLTGEPHDAFTPQLQDRVYVNFRDEAFYFVNLFDLIWRLYGLSFDNPLLDELRAAMSPQRNR